MQTQLIPIDSIAQDPRNARTKDARRLQKDMAELLRNGQQKPLVVGRDNRMIYSGNGVYQAARKLAWRLVLVEWTDLFPWQAVAYGVADKQPQA